MKCEHISASLMHQLLKIIRGEQSSEKMSGESAMLCVTDTLLPVCSSVNRSSGGLAGAQRAGFLVCLWVLSTDLTLTWPKACVTRMPNFALTSTTKHSELTAVSQPS